MVEDNGGDLPTFPLSLGSAPAGDAGSRSTELFDDDDAKTLLSICRESRAGFIEAILAVAALASYDFTGKDRYLGITPRSTRSTPEDFAAAGWFTSLIPVPVELDPTSTFPVRRPADPALVPGGPATLRRVVSQGSRIGRARPELSDHHEAGLVGTDGLGHGHPTHARGRNVRVNQCEVLRKPRDLR